MQNPHLSSKNLSAEAPPGYSPAERVRRWAMARELMASAGLDALVVHSGHETMQGTPLLALDAYFTNDRTGSVVVFVRDEDPVQLVRCPMVVGTHIDARRRGDALWIEPARIRFGRDPHHVAGVLAGHGLQNGRIGVVGIEPHPQWHDVPNLPHVFYAPLAEQLPGAALQPVWPSLMARMLPNSPEELALVRHASAIGDAVVEELLDVVRPGVSENEVVAAAVAEGLRLGAQTPPPAIASGKDFVSMGPPVPAHRPQPSRILEEGDVVVTEVRTSIALKESQSQVTIAVGEVSADTRRAAWVAQQCYEAGLALLRPGHTFGEVADAMVSTVREAGGWNVRPMVHSMNPPGPLSGYGWGMRTLGPAQEEYGGLGEVPTVGAQLALQPGMTFALQPSCVLGGRMANLGGTVIVGEDGPLELNTITGKLLHV